MKRGSIVIAAAVMMTQTVNAAENGGVDDCAEVGKLVLMLHQLDGICPKYQLTDAGRHALAAMTGQATILGGEICIDKGKSELNETVITHSNILALSASGADESTLRSTTCEAIAKYIRLLTAGDESYFEKKQ